MFKKKLKRSRSLKVLALIVSQAFIVTSAFAYPISGGLAKEEYLRVKAAAHNNIAGDIVSFNRGIGVSFTENNEAIADPKLELRQIFGPTQLPMGTDKKVIDEREEERGNIQGALLFLRVAEDVGDVEVKYWEIADFIQNRVSILLTVPENDSAFLVARSPSEYSVMHHGLTRNTLYMSIKMYEKIKDDPELLAGALVYSGTILKLWHDFASEQEMTLKELSQWRKKKKNREAVKNLSILFSKQAKILEEKIVYKRLDDIINASLFAAIVKTRKIKIANLDAGIKVLSGIFFNDAYKSNFSEANLAYMEKRAGLLKEERDKLYDEIESFTKGLKPAERDILENDLENDSRFQLDCNIAEKQGIIEQFERLMSISAGNSKMTQSFKNQLVDFVKLKDVTEQLIQLGKKRAQWRREVKDSAREEKKNKKPKVLGRVDKVTTSAIDGGVLVEGIKTLRDDLYQEVPGTNGVAVRSRLDANEVYVATSESTDRMKIYSKFESGMKKNQIKLSNFRPFFREVIEENSLEYIPGSDKKLAWNPELPSVIYEVKRDENGENFLFGPQGGGVVKVIKQKKTEISRERDIVNKAYKTAELKGKIDALETVAAKTQSQVEPYWPKGKLAKEISELENEIAMLGFSDFYDQKVVNSKGIEKELELARRKAQMEKFEAIRTGNYTKSSKAAAVKGIFNEVYPKEMRMLEAQLTEALEKNRQAVIIDWELLKNDPGLVLMIMEANQTLKFGLAMPKPEEKAVNFLKEVEKQTYKIGSLTGKFDFYVPYALNKAQVIELVKNIKTEQAVEKIAALGTVEWASLYKDIDDCIAIACQIGTEGGNVAQGPEALKAAMVLLNTEIFKEEAEKYAANRENGVYNFASRDLGHRLQLIMDYRKELAVFE